MDFRIQTIPEISSGFTKFPIFGFISIIFAGAALVMFVQHFFGSNKTFGIAHGKAWMFLGAQSLFALLIALFVFSSDMQAIPSAQLRFGLFLSIFSHFLILFGGYVEEKSRQKSDAIASLTPTPSPYSGVNIRAEQPEMGAEQLSLSDADAGRKQPILRR